MQEVQMSTCYRCGVDFDDSEFIKGSPCGDCQLDFFESYLRIDVAAEREHERTAYWVRYWYDKRYSDREIGEAIGMKRHQVVAWRKKLDLPAHTFGGTEKWRDPDKVMADLSDRLKGNSYRKGKKATRAGIKAENGRKYSE